MKRPALQFHLPKQTFSNASETGYLIKTNLLLHGLKHIRSSEMSAHCIMSDVFDLLLFLYLKFTIPRKILTMTVCSAGMSLLPLQQTSTARCSRVS
jgi:hypothetical protein